MSSVLILATRLLHAPAVRRPDPRFAGHGACGKRPSMHHVLVRARISSMTHAAAIRWVNALLFALTWWATMNVACAADPAYPNRPVRLVVPFPPAGPNDTLARIVAQKMSENLGQTVIVDNRGGGSGIIGTEIVARAFPDGYTLLFGGSNIATNVSVYRKLPYDAEKDFAPITQVAFTPYLLVVHPALNVATVSELIAVAKAKPGGVTYASASIGSANHLAGELFNRMAGIRMVHVPYRGGGPALADVIGGHVDLIFNNPLTVLGHVRAGRLKALAVTSLRRSSVIPSVPTVAESGLAGFDVTGWYGVLGPARLPPAIVGKLHREIVKVLRMADVGERLAGQGLEPVGNAPDEYAALIKTEIKKWAKVVADSGARID
jgi:tripartite-type tricarboxylate transporter receptor subunit TctC